MEEKKRENSPNVYFVSLWGRCSFSSPPHSSIGGAVASLVPFSYSSRDETKILQPDSWTHPGPVFYQRSKVINISGDQKNDKKIPDPTKLASRSRNKKETRLSRSELF